MICPVTSIILVILICPFGLGKPIFEPKEIFNSFIAKFKNTAEPAPPAKYNYDPREHFYSMFLNSSFATMIVNDSQEGVPTMPMVRGKGIFDLFAPATTSDTKERAYLMFLKSLNDNMTLTTIPPTSVSQIADELGQECSKNGNGKCNNTNEEGSSTSNQTRMDEVMVDVDGEFSTEAVDEFTPKAIMRIWDGMLKKDWKPKMEQSVEAEESTGMEEDVGRAEAQSEARQGETSRTATDEETTLPGRIEHYGNMTKLVLTRATGKDGQTIIPETTVKVNRSTTEKEQVTEVPATEVMNIESVNASNKTDHYKEEVNDIRILFPDQL